MFVVPRASLGEKEFEELPRVPRITEPHWSLFDSFCRCSCVWVTWTSWTLFERTAEFAWTPDILETLEESIKLEVPVLKPGIVRWHWATLVWRWSVGWTWQMFVKVKNRWIWTANLTEDSTVRTLVYRPVPVPTPGCCLDLQTLTRAKPPWLHPCLHVQYHNFSPCHMEKAYLSIHYLIKRWDTPHVWILTRTVTSFRRWICCPGARGWTTADRPLWLCLTVPGDIIRHSWTLSHATGLINSGAQPSSTQRKPVCCTPLS